MYIYLNVCKEMTDVKLLNRLNGRVGRMFAIGPGYLG